MTSDNPAGLEPGTTLALAMISPVSGGLIRTWTEAESRLWSVDKPAALAELIGRGLLARTEVSDNLFREVAMLDAATGTLMVQERVPTDAGQIAARVFQLTEPVAPQNNPWDDFQDFMAASALAVAQSGEFLSVEPGGWDAAPTPSFFFTLMEEEGSLVSVIEGTPAPRGSEVWPEAAADAEACVLQAPLAEDTLAVVAVFAASALDSWQLDPWAVALTFGKPEERE